MRSLQAAGSDPTTLTTWLPSVSPLVAALITGFGAAALKRRWDVATETRQWTRQSSERTRAELLNALGALLTERQGLASMPSRLEATSAGALLDPSPELAGYRLAAAKVLLLLDEGDGSRIQADVEAVEAWAAQVVNELAAGAPPTAGPSADGLVAVCRSMLSRVPAE